MAEKHRQLAHQVGVFIEHPLENSMASFDFTSAMLNEGIIFNFGSYICVTNGLGCFNSHLANSKEPEASSSTPSSDLDEFIDNLNDLLFPDLGQQIKKMSVFNATSTHDAPDLVRSEKMSWSEKTTRSKSLSDLEEDLDLLLKTKDMGATACWGTPLSTSTRTPMKSTPRAVLHLQAGPEKDSETREPPLVGRPPPLKTTHNPMATPNYFWAAIWVYP
jgi:hypothetical protein